VITVTTITNVARLRVAGGGRSRANLRQNGWRVALWSPRASRFAS
jgi:hypothetical protein